MRKIMVFLVLVTLFSCRSTRKPDVSSIQVSISVQRFEQDFFSIDTSDLPGSLNLLKQKYPDFFADFFYQVMGLPLDSTETMSPQIAAAIQLFLRDYQPVKDASDKIFENFSRWEKEVIQALKYAKFYFPDHDIPDTLTTFIGPFDAFFVTSFGVQGDILTHTGFGVGLQLHLGKDYSFFKSETGQELYPTFISETFEPGYIAVNCMKNLIDDYFPPKEQSSALVERMVNSGRRYYLLSLLLPDADDALILGYTPDQARAAHKNEAVIWDFFLNNDLLNNSDDNIIKNYIGPSPKTQEFGEGSPGNIGSFAGLQIVRKYMQKNPDTSPEELMRVEPREVYEQSKYKPRA